MHDIRAFFMLKSNKIFCIVFINKLKTLLKNFIFFIYYDIINKMENLLNEVQNEIVKTTEGPVMVLAGAGSGKTRVLTYRIAYILKNGLARPHQVLAITFTNKAANEIKSRLFSMGYPCKDVWAMTFHSMCCRILRSEAKYLDGYTSSFSIFDEQEKKSVIKKIVKELNLKDDSLVSEVNDKLSKYKMSNMTLEQYKSISCFIDHDKLVFDIMQKYEDRLKQENAMDFDDLINKTLWLLKSNEYVREKYQEQFRYILVDEFQDTNETQYELVKILGAYHQNVFCVGDEDQSIYSWRGASIDNIQKFLKSFPNTKLFKLEQNYRSTKNIIENANKIIKNNINRIDKTLFTENAVGDRVVYNKSFTDRDEADFVVRTIFDLVNTKGYKYKDIAILMRLNALTRNFEEKFISYNIPYKIFGGLKFYERAEIKNVMAYFKLLVNPFDEESFLRIINFPKRGIGDGAIQKLKDISYGQSLFNTVMSLNDNEIGTLAKFLPFKDLMADFREQINKMKMFDFAKYVIDKTNILAEYADDTDEDTNRKLNIGELLQNIKNYQDENPGKTFVDFLQTVTLATDIDSYEEEDNSVVLATVHSVKGLEFKVVFVIGLEEKYFPIIRLDSTDLEMEEERRLMYVAITRAKEKLFLTCSKSRYMYGKQNYSQVSRFLKELGFEKDYQENGFKKYDFESDDGSETNYQQQYYYNRKNTYHSSQNINKINSGLNGYINKTTSQKQNNFVVGDRVFHTNFGVGYVVLVDEKTKIIKIDFEKFGNKVLSIDFAPIKKL